MKIKLLFIALTLCMSIFNVFAQEVVPSTSPTYVANPANVAAPNIAMANVAANTITFSEFPRGAAITDQYKNKGVIFTTACFITADGANPTSPVLSGTPIFDGPIGARFVIPGTTAPAVVASFSLDAGYFDVMSTTRIEWFDDKGKKLGQTINSVIGIQHFTIKGGNISSFMISVVANEPAGYAIDNLTFEAVNSSVVFRETHGPNQNKLFGIFTGELPGFDHTGFSTGGKVYESHPGYGSGTYVSEDGVEAIPIVTENGVQSQFTKGTFRWESNNTGFTPMKEFVEVPIDETLAGMMKLFIETKGNFSYPDFINGVNNIFDIFRRSSPERQKGMVDQTFTCVGLIERAAEVAGHNGGKGFVPDHLEFIEVDDPDNPAAKLKIPVLVPTFLLYSMQYQDIVAKSKQWLLGLFDPVDFLIIDPLGRRLGFVPGIGLINEIPYAFYTGDGSVEQIFIPTALPGVYQIKFYGKNSEMFAALSSQNSSFSFAGNLADGQIIEKTYAVGITPSAMGDVNGDGLINNDDITLLLTKLNRFTNGLGDPGDLDGNGLISNNDVILLQQLINVLQCDLNGITAGNDKTVYYGYAPMASTTLSVSGIPNSDIGNYNYLWSNGKTTSTITENPTQTTTYTLTVSKNGCTTTDQVTVNVVDVRCGNGKVKVCHKAGKHWNQLCIAPSAVASHLAHGDVLGDCNNNSVAPIASVQTTTEEDVSKELEIEITRDNSGRIKIILSTNNNIDLIKYTIFDVMGRMLESKIVQAGKIIEMKDTYNNGIYIIRVVQGEEVRSVKFLKQ